MGTAYRVKDWGKHFENSETKKIKRLKWVPIPVKQDGDGYTAMLDAPAFALEAGIPLEQAEVAVASHFAAWTVLLQVAAKCEPRGTLVRDGGIPHDPRSLSRITRISPGIFRGAFPRLVKVGWLEEIGQAPEISASAPENPVIDRTEQNRTEGKETEGKGTEEQQLTAPRVAVPDKPPGMKPNNNGRHPPCLLALSLPYFGCAMAVAEAYVAEAVGKVGEELALAWLLSADEDRRAGKIKTNPLQYYRGLLKKGEPDDRWLAEAKRLLRPHTPPAKDRGPQTIGEVAHA